MPNGFGRFTAIALIAITCWAQSGHSAVRGAEPSPPTLALLETGWKPSLAAYEAAHQKYVQARAAGPRDLRTAYAMTLVAIQHHKLREAAKFLDDALAARPNNLHLRKVKLWLLFANKEYKTGLAEMPAFARDLAAAAADNAAAEMLRDNSQALGELIGFIEGPASVAVKAADVDAVEQQIVKALPPAGLEAFRAARAGIAEQHKQFAAEFSEVRTKAKLEEDADRELDLAKLRQVRELCQAAVASMPARYEKRAEQLSARLQKTIAENKITTKINEKTGAVTSKGTHDSEIRTLEQELAGLPAQQVNERAQLADQDNRAAKRLAQLERKSEQKADTTTAENGPSTALRKRIDSFTSYSEFPLEAERQKLIESFGKK